MQKFVIKYATDPKTQPNCKWEYVTKPYDKDDRYDQLYVFKNRVHAERYMKDRMTTWAHHIKIVPVTSVDNWQYRSKDRSTYVR